MRAIISYDVLYQRTRLRARVDRYNVRSFWSRARSLACRSDSIRGQWDATRSPLLIDVRRRGRRRVRMQMTKLNIAIMCEATERFYILCICCLVFKLYRQICTSAVDRLGTSPISGRGRDAAISCGRTACSGYVALRRRDGRGVPDRTIIIAGRWP